MPSTVEHNEKSQTAPEAKNDAPVQNFENPKWLTAELFEKLLKDTVANYKSIKCFETKPALAPGENYVTIILRVHIDIELVDGTPKSLSYILKLPQEVEAYKDMMRKHNIFEIEYRMYHEVVPEFEQLYRQSGIELNFSAKCYHIEAPSEFGVILLQDMRPLGYKNANRLEGLDLEHTQAVLERLAQWHAASAVRVETKGLYPELFNKGMLAAAGGDSFTNFIISIKSHVFESVKAIEGSEAYIDSVTNTLDKMVGEILRTEGYDSSEFNVLNHGDCWCNNMMFKYDSEGKLEDALLVDYQMINYGSPAKDLHYFLTSSTRYELKVNRFDYFIKFYHDNLYFGGNAVLVKNLMLLKYPKKPPTLKDMHIAMLKHGLCGFAAAVGAMPAALLESNSDATIDGFVGETEAGARFRNALYTNPSFRKHMEIVVPFMNNRGVFEM
ncbi:uncharacterized protein LOC129240618 [Anastrepha obliqua]|uniref:uncharacterized protein LOC129240618 n=1 Tax=Anastrepha obliqua TaxID=95512 RepID=UPI0024091C53|nr:uncharacterized protein LOC129240618 [Anastrepha obliqua]